MSRLDAFGEHALDGYNAAKRGQTVNPWPAESREAREWQRGADAWRAIHPSSEAGIGLRPPPGEADETNGVADTASGAGIGLRPSAPKAPPKRRPTPTKRKPARSRS